MRLRYTRRAELDLIDIWKYIARDRPLTADQVLRRIDRQCRLIRDFPEIGRRRPDLAPQVRSFPIERWLILYRSGDHEVVISRIVDGARHLRRRRALELEASNPAPPLRTRLFDKKLDQEAGVQNDITHRGSRGAGRRCRSDRLAGSRLGFGSAAREPTCQPRLYAPRLRRGPDDADLPFGARDPEGSSLKDQCSSSFHRPTFSFPAVTWSGAKYMILRRRGTAALIYGSRRARLAGAPGGGTRRAAPRIVIE